MRDLCALTVSALLLAACATSPVLSVTPSPASTQPDTQIPPSPASFPTHSQAETVDALINLIEASDPASTLYDPNSLAYIDFPLALPELAKLNSETNSAASELAYAIGFPRPDSTLAAGALLSLGPQWAGTTLPILLDHLKNPRPEVRLYALIVLSTIGPDGSCALGQVGPLLWDSDPSVRTAAALATQSLSGRALVANMYVVDPSLLSATPVIPDTPEGHVVSHARAWWSADGSKVNWRPAYGRCDP